MPASKGNDCFLWSPLFINLPRQRGVYEIKGDLTSTLGGGNYAILVATETGEDYAVGEYKKALDETLPAPVRKNVDRQFQNVKRALDKVKSMRDSLDKSSASASRLSKENRRSKQLRQLSPNFSNAWLVLHQVMRSSAQTGAVVFRHSLALLRDDPCDKTDNHDDKQGRHPWPAVSGQPVQ